MLRVYPGDGCPRREPRTPELYFPSRFSPHQCPSWRSECLRSMAEDRARELEHAVNLRAEISIICPSTTHPRSLHACGGDRVAGQAGRGEQLLYFDMKPILSRPLAATLL